MSFFKRDEQGLFRRCTDQLSPTRGLQKLLLPRIFVSSGFEAVGLAPAVSAFDFGWSNDDMYNFCTISKKISKRPK